MCNNAQQGRGYYFFEIWILDTNQWNGDIRILDTDCSHRIITFRNLDIEVKNRDIVFLKSGYWDIATPVPVH